MEMPKEDKKVLKYKHGEKSFNILLCQRAVFP